MKQQVKLLNEALAKTLGKKQGDIVAVKCDKKGIPLEREWRNRFKDKKIDNCIELIKASKESK